jgi:hypothetical protein
MRSSVWLRDERFSLRSSAGPEAKSQVATDRVAMKTLQRGFA